jgi:hypothetical protein
MRASTTCGIPKGAPPGRTRFSVSRLMWKGCDDPSATCGGPEACGALWGPAILNPPAVVHRAPGPFGGQGRSGRLGIVETSKADLHMACRR